MVFVAPLDFETIFINGLSGSVTVFIFICLIAIGFLAARFRMNNTVTLLMIALFGIIVAQYLSNNLYAFIIIIAGMAIFYAIGRIVK